MIAKVSKQYNAEAALEFLGHKLSEASQKEDDKLEAYLWSFHLFTSAKERE